MGGDLGGLGGAATRLSSSISGEVTGAPGLLGFVATDGGGGFQGWVGGACVGSASPVSQSELSDWFSSESTGGG